LYDWGLRRQAQESHRRSRRSHQQFINKKSSNKTPVMFLSRFQHTKAK
jgi:hypothetical protein